MFPNCRYLAFYGQPKKTLVINDLTVDAKMSMDTFVADVLNEFGLYIGKPMNWGAFYSEHASLILKKSQKTIFATNAANPKMNSRSFIRKYFDFCSTVPLENCFIFSFKRFPKFFNLYFKKATGIDKKFGAKVLKVLIDGLRANLREACDGKMHIWIEENNMLCINFKVDEELEKRFEFENNFSEIYEQLARTPTIPIIFADPKDFSELLEKINKLSVQYRADSELIGYLRILKKMIMEAKTRGTCIGVRMIPGKDA